MDIQKAIERYRETAPPCVTTLGNGEVVAADPDAGTAAMQFQPTEAHCHSGNIVQGGFITGMLDAAMAHAVLFKTGFELQPVSLEIKTSFLAPVNPQRLRAEGTILHMGRSVAFLEGRLLSEDGTVLARGSQTAKLFSLTNATA